MAQAEAPPVFGEHGEGAGQMQEAHGIALDEEGGDVYVADNFNARVDEFSGEGEFIRSWGWGVFDGEERLQACTTASGCLAGLGGSGAGQLNRPAGVAVDNSAGFSHGDVYVVDSANARVEKFDAEGKFVLMFGGEVNMTKDGTSASTAEKDLCTQEEIELAGVKCGPGVSGEVAGEFAGLGNTIAVNSEGSVYVGDGSGRVQRFGEGGAYEATSLEGIGGVEGLAVASNGDLYVLSNGKAGVREYEPNGSEVGPARDPSGAPRALAASVEGGVLVDDRSESEEHHIFAYDAAGTQTASFDKQPFSLDAQNGFAFNKKVGLLYLLNHFDETGGGRFVEVDDVRTVVVPPPGPYIIPPVSVSPLPHRTAVVKALINPENAETEYFVEYGTSAPSSTSTVKKLAASFAESEVSVELTGLEFSTEYHYCLIAKNVNGTTPCVESTFVSAPATAIDTEWVQNVSSESATLAAEVNPEEVATECRFEYGTAANYRSTGSFEHVILASPIVAPENADVVVSAHAQEGIAPGVEYVYRLVCEKAGITDEGQVQSFRSQSQPHGTALPDGRTLEVTAADVNGAALVPPGLGGLPQSSGAGDAIAYLRRASSSTNTMANRAPELTVDIARHRQPGGWSSIDITTPYGSAAPLEVGKGTEYLLFNGDISAAVVAPRDATPLAPNATERTPYRRTEPAGEALYEPLLTSTDVAEGVKFGEERAVEVEGANATLTHVVLTSQVALLAEGVPGALYEWSAGRLAPVSVLPADEGGAVVEGGLGGPHAGAHTGNARGAISADGSLVYWRHGVGLYVRDTRTGESLRLDVPQEGVTPRGGEVEGSEFQIASANGSRVFFTATRRLTPGANANGEAPDLYECTITAPPAGKLSCALTDVTENTMHAGEHADVQGLVAAADEAGDRVFFVARGALASSATAGAYNLYGALQAGGGWQVTWIATLSSEDAEDWAASGVEGLRQLTERSSPDGRWFTFMSQRSLTGYDNRDVESGVPDEEVYLYDTQNDRLACISCASTGGRPHGFFDEEKLQTATSTPVDIEGIWRRHWVAGLLPAWQSLSITGGGITAYQPRSLSDSGRLFFESATALTPQAANGTVGVYEFEPPGVGSCAAGTAGYSSVTGGCVGLISPGTAASDSVFMDASANGDDAFVMSRGGGLATEGGGLAPYSVLDAHSCEAGSSWPCTSAAPSGPAGCGSTAGCEGEIGESTPLNPSPASSIASKSLARVKPVRYLNSHALRRCRSRARRIKNAGRRRRALARCAKRYTARAWHDGSRRAGH